MPRYKIRMPDGEDFTFSWDKPNKPTKSDVLSLYEATKKPKEESEPEKPFLSRAWETITKPTLPNVDFKSGGYFGPGAERAMDWLYTRMVQPASSPLGIATLPMAAAGTTGRALLGAGGATLSAMQMPQLFKNYSENPTWEGVGDIALSGLGLAGGTALAKRSVMPLAKPFPVIDNPGENIIPQHEPVNLPTKSTVQPIQPSISKPDYGIKPTPGVDPTGSGLTVPNRLSGPSTNQTVIDALLPSRTREQVGMSKRGVNINDTMLDIPGDETRPPVARSKNPIVDTGIKSKNATISKISLEADKALESARSSMPKSEASAAGATPSEASIRNVSIPEKLFQSGMRTLEKLGDSGKQLALKINRIRADADRLTGEAEANIRKYSNQLTKQEKQNFGNYVENPDTIPNDRVRAAVNAYNFEVEKSGIYAENAKLNIRNAAGEKMPFQRIKENYWARQYPEGYFDGPEGRQSLFNELVKEGMSPDEAKQVVQGSAKFGERFIDSQYARQYYKIPGYRVDIDAAFKHLREIYRRSQEAIELGSEDIGDPVTSELIKKTTNPQIATEILEQQLGRTKHDPQAMKFVHAVNSAEAAVTLPFMAVGNFTQRFAPVLRSNMISFAKALKNTLTQHKATKESAMRAGALEPVQAVFRVEGGQGLISKLYGMTATEEGNRILASETGKMEALSSFDKLKKNPNSKIYRNRLSDLLLDDVDTVLKQDSLTPEQVQRAQYRMAQITQGLTDPVDLPVYWNRSPYAKLPAFLKRFAFQQSRMMKDAIMESPVRNIAVGLGLYSLIGEGIGDVKTGLNLLLKQPFKDSDTPFVEELQAAIAQRSPDDEEGFFQSLSPDTTGWLADRVSKNLTNAFALGLVEDALQSVSSGYPSSLLEFITGKAISDAAKITKETYAGAKEGDWRKIGRVVTDISPLTRPIGRELFKSKSQREKEQRRPFVPSRPKVEPLRN